MAQFRGFGTGADGDLAYAGGNLGGVAGFGVASFTGTAGNNFGTFTDAGYFNGSNGGRVGDLCVVHQSQITGSGSWEIMKITSRVGTTVYFDKVLVNTYSSGAQIVSSGNFNNLTLNGTTTPYTAWGGSSGGILFLVAKNNLNVAGTINASSYGFRGYGTLSTTKQAGKQGEGYPNANYSVSDAANGNGGGGGPISGYDTAGAGGGGGNGTAGGTGQAGQSHSSDNQGVGGYGGAAVGSANLTTMFFGGSGGTGGSSAGSNPGGGGGNGGGIIILMAKNITVTGGVYSNGANGVSSSVGGGGGAGGSILFKGQKVILGSGLVTANAGAGGVGGLIWDYRGYNVNNNGGAGGVGRIHADYSISISGTTSPTLDSTLDITVKAPPSGGALLSEFI